MKTEKEILGIIRKKRISKSLSQNEFSEQIGLSQSAYSKLENGTTSLTIQQLNAILIALDIPQEELFVSDDLEKRKNFRNLLKMSEELIEFKENKIKNLEVELEKLRNKKAPLD
ncbi:MAG: helix-turn-helix transcriptional regulator [Vicingaceae bacterium]